MRAENGTLGVGLLPLAAVANGHSFFVQHPCAMCRPCACGAPLPYAVHATFQYGDAADFAHGKRCRLRQAGLWAVSDAPEVAAEPRHAGLWAVSDAPEAAAEPRHAGPGQSLPAGGAAGGAGGAGGAGRVRYIQLDGGALDAEMAAAAVVTRHLNDSRAMVAVRKPTLGAPAAWNAAWPSHGRRV